MFYQKYESKYLDSTVQEISEILMEQPNFPPAQVYGWNLNVLWKLIYLTIIQNSQQNKR